MNRKELEKYIYTYGKDLYSFCCSITRNRQEADDLYQDTFLKLYEIRENLVVNKNPKSFLMSVSVNLYRNYKRKLLTRQKIIGLEMSVDEMVIDIPSTERMTEEKLIVQEESRILHAMIKKLPDKYRIPILLFYMEELSLSDVSQIMKLPEGTVKSRIYRAKKILKQKLEDMHYER